MTPWKTKVIRSALEALYYSRIYQLIETKWSGVGVIFTLHHVRHQSQFEDFSPNRILEVDTVFLDQTIQQVRALGYDIVSLDEARRRLIEKVFHRKFVCFTLDDGYLDNYVHAFPIFRKHQAPFTVYVTTGLPDGTAVLWWRCLERVVLQHDVIELRLNNKTNRFVSRSTIEKYRAFEKIYWALRRMPLEEQNEALQYLNGRYRINATDLCNRSAMRWDMIKELSESGLATIGAHTINHYALNKLSEDHIRDEAKRGREVLVKRLNTRPKHFAYPYGDRSSASAREIEIVKSLGFDTATTTRKGVIFPEHVQYLHALPRISLNGDYQKHRYVRVFLSGAASALAQRFRRLDIN